MNSNTNFNNGYPVQIVSVDASRTSSSFCLNEKLLEKILLREDVKHKTVSIISIAGAFRKGKSFLLDFFLRFLFAKDANSWLDDKDTPLVGFPWRGGSERETIGITMWSEPAFITLPGREEIALLLMDTQGSFDSQSTVKECATVFALSTMLSSLQIYNLQSNIQEDNLQYLQLFTEYGRLAIDAGYDFKPFESLLFLVRDWSYSYEHEYGYQGGQQLLDKRLDENCPNLHSELKDLRKHLKSCFYKLFCFLLPHPGLEVAQSQKFIGQVKDINEVFVDHIRVLVPSLLNPKNLRTKKINGFSISSASLFEYFKAYMKIFSEDTLPEPKSILLATAEANNLSLIMDCRDFYIESMNKICGPNMHYVNQADVEVAHLKYKMEALSKFENKPKMGSKDLCNSSVVKLEQTIDKLGEDFLTSNANKNVFKNLKTPACLMIVMIVTYFITGLTQLIGLDALTKLALMPFYICLIALLSWIILMYAGQAPYAIEMIDKASELFFNMVVIPAAQYLGHLQMRHMQ